MELSQNGLFTGIPYFMSFNPIITVKYLGDLRTEMTHLASGTVLITDAPKDNHGKGESFSPTDTVSGALAACMMTIMGIAARTHSIELIGTLLEVEKIMGTDPRRIAGINIRISIKGSDFSEKNMAILERAAKTCPVALSLHPELIQNLEWIWP